MECKLQSSHNPKKKKKKALLNSCFAGCYLSNSFVEFSTLINPILGPRFISFGFDSFESEVGGGLVSALRFGSEFCVWFLRKYKKIWVLSFMFRGRKSGFEFSVWGAKNLGLIFVVDALVVYWCGGFIFLNLFMFNFVLMWI